MIRVQVDELELKNGLRYYEGNLFNGIMNHYDKFEHKKSDFHFVDGVKTKFVGYFKGGQIQVCSQVFEPDNQYEISEVWYESGQRKSISLSKDGKSHKIYEWSEDGNVLVDKLENRFIIRRIIDILEDDGICLNYQIVQQYYDEDYNEWCDDEWYENFKKSVLELCFDSNKKMIPNDSVETYSYEDESDEYSFEEFNRIIEEDLKEFNFKKVFELKDFKYKYDKFKNKSVSSKKMKKIYIKT